MDKCVKLLVGNIGAEVNEASLREVFSATSGMVNSVLIPVDPKTGKNRGYAMVEMNTGVDAQQVVKDLNGAECLGRALAISVVQRELESRKWYKLGAR